MTNDRYRLWQLLLFIISTGVLLASFYFQYYQGLQPCPLCIMQRLCVLIATILALTGLLLGKHRLSIVLLISQVVIASAGLYFAGRQLWLQSLPTDQLPACLPGLDVLVRYFPWRDVIHALIWGAADCGEVTWQWLGISMPGWVVGYFSGLLLAAVVTWRLRVNDRF